MPYTQLIHRAIQAQSRAIVPYSDFRVGAALLTDSDQIYTGCNIESSSYGLTLCAERVALFKALSEGEQSFKAIAIATPSDLYCPPCGACRQVLWDFAGDIDVILVARTGKNTIVKLSDLFPHPFDDGFLIHD